MIRNYIKVGLRNIARYKVFSFINMFGLAAAMSVCMLIILMLADQNRYDQFHVRRDRIYRILSNYEGARMAYATSAMPVGPGLKSAYEGFVAQSAKVGQLYVDLAQELYKPFESQWTKATAVK